ncbi:metal ABC transporter ATP-binding protein [Pseudodesulfovibrio sp.]|uniref:metal ABC transporter ATP-binding protein n=1 Tax=unclassified Pseudodesulfovibrio TaxID=2661612 RepID=UPI003B005520
MGAGDDIIRLSGVSAAYGRHVAMRGVDLTMRRGDFLGVIGPNGAGKTTLLTVVNGLSQLVAGRVEVLGQPLLKGTEVSLRKRIGYVAQMQEVDPLLPITVRESVLTGCYGRLGPFRRIPASIRQRAEELLRLVGLSDLATRPLGRLSGGEKQRTAIARALLQEPEILLLDEPTAALDWQAQREILALIQDIHTRFSLTSLIVTHDLNSLPDVCTRVAFMKAGRLTWSGSPQEAVDGPRLSQLYNTPIMVVRHNGRDHIVR